MKRSLLSNSLIYNSEGKENTSSSYYSTPRDFKKIHKKIEKNNSAYFRIPLEDITNLIIENKFEIFSDNPSVKKNLSIELGNISNKPSNKVKTSSIRNFRLMR
jgi:hypothetical protein